MTDLCSCHITLDDSVSGDLLDITREASCRPSEFKCSDNKTCISRSKFCNTVRDCPDGSDELNCRTYCSFVMVLLNVS